MKHKNIEKNLILFLDGDLNENEKKEIQDHLINCEKCSHQIKIIESLWNSGNHQVVSPPFLWSEIQNNIEGNTKKGNSKFNLHENIFTVLRPVAFIIILIATILMGNILGRSIIYKSASDSTSTEHNIVVKEFYLDRLDPIPPESLAKSALFLEAVKGEKK